MSFLSLLATIRNPFLDSLMLAVSHLGSPFFIVGLIAWFYLNISKEEAYAMGLSFCYSCLLCQGIKILARVPRPWNLDTTFEPAKAAVSSATGYSFPSVHSQSTASFGFTLFHYNKKKAVRIVSLVYIGLIAFSRMYLGCHTPVDVGTGILIALIVTAITCFLWNRHHRSFEGDNMLPFFLMAFAIVLICLTAALLGNGTVDFANAKDSFETAGVSIGFAIACYVECRTIRFSVSGTKPKKILRFLLALAGALAINYGLRVLSSTSIPLIIIRYSLMLLWITLATPVLSIRAGLMSRSVAVRRTPEI